MDYRIVGDNLPAVICRLSRGESLYCESGSMAWMDDSIKMETEGGGIGKVFGRMLSGERLFRNKYTAERDGEIAFASTFPGNIRAIDICPGSSVIAQKGSFLAAETGVDMSIFFQKKISGGFFGGEGFIMQKFEGSGKLFIEIDGSEVEYELSAGEKKIVDTGYLVMMDGSCSLDVQMIKGAKNIFLGGEGLFNTVITGPGRIILQTMPVQKTAMMLYGLMPKTGSN